MPVKCFGFFFRRKEGERNESNGTIKILLSDFIDRHVLRPLVVDPDGNHFKQCQIFARHSVLGLLTWFRQLLFDQADKSIQGQVAFQNMIDLIWRRIGIVAFTNQVYCLMQ